MSGIDNFTTLCVHCDGTNGSTTFPDASSSSHTVTASGSVTVSTSSPKFGTGSGSFTGGASDNLIVGGTLADFNFGTGDWTVDFWIKTTQTSRSDVAGLNTNFNNAGWWGFIFSLSASGQMAFFENANARIAASATGYNDGSWHHIAVSRSGSNLRMFLDGTQVGSTFTTSFNYGDSTSGLILGQQNGGAGPTACNIDEIRVSKGTARWTSNFTPPTSAYSNVSGAPSLMPLLGVG